MSKRLLYLCACCSLLSVGCTSGSTYRSEFGGIQSVGMTDTSQMSRGEMHSAIEHAYLDGELTAEQARKAHMQLDVKGHLTAEQIAVINRDRLAERHKYETQKETLDVYRDTTRTGSSVLSDIHDMRHTIEAIFD